jgi:hypothetical protein
MTLPNYNGGSGFYDPGKTYRGLIGTNPTTFQQIDPLLYQNYGTETNPQGVYRAGLAKMGLGGFGSRARVAQGLYPQVQAGYQAAKAGSNAELFFPEFLDQTKVGDIFNSLSYEAQGLDPGRFGQRQYRWSMRG